jgi:hypothetical protein
MIEHTISDELIDQKWGYANFGTNISKREVIANALLKYACGFATGYTIEQICLGLKLINKNCQLTTLGKQYLWQSYSNNLSV